MEAEQRTAPRVYGTLEVVCEGVGEWCGQAVPVNVEILAGYPGTHARAECPACGREHVVHVIETKSRWFAGEQV
jgi:hypothetical protein